MAWSLWHIHWPILATVLLLNLCDDRVTETVRRETFQEAAAALRDGLYLVPRVVELARMWTPSPRCETCPLPFCART